MRRNRTVQKSNHCTCSPTEPRAWPPRVKRGFHKQRNATQRKSLIVALRCVVLRCVCYIRNATQKKYAFPVYRDGNKCAKNCCKRTILVQLIVSNFISDHSVGLYAAEVVKKVTVYLCPFLRRPSSTHYSSLLSLWILLFFYSISMDISARH